MYSVQCLFVYQEKLKYHTTFNGRYRSVHRLSIHPTEPDLKTVSTTKSLEVIQPQTAFYLFLLMKKVVWTKEEKCMYFGMYIMRFVHNERFLVFLQSTLVCLFWFNGPSTAIVMQGQSLYSRVGYDLHMCAFIVCMLEAVVFMLCLLWDRTSNGIF